MTFQAAIYRILIASPSDVVAERKVIPEVFYSWNAINSVDFGVVLLPVMWETHSAPEMGDRPQAIINKQIVKDCDILIGTFWTRIGTDTGIAESGTLEEIAEFKAAGKHVMLYFSSAPVTPDCVDLEQYQKLMSYKKRCQKEGLIYSYASVEELKDKLNRHLTCIIRKFHNNTQQPRACSKRKNIFNGQYKIFVRKFEADWTVEKNRKPHRLDDAKYILKRLDKELFEFRSVLVGHVDQKIISTFDEVLIQTRTLQQHIIYIYGEESHRKFWEKGDSIITTLKEQMDSF